MKYKKLLEIDFLPNEKAKKFDLQLPTGIQNASLEIIAIEQTAPTDEKIFFVSCTQNQTETILSKTPLKNQNTGLIPISDFLKDYFRIFPNAMVGLDGLRNFFEKIKMPLHPQQTKVKGTIYTTEPTGHSTIQIILKYE